MRYHCEQSIRGTFGMQGSVFYDPTYWSCVFYEKAVRYGNVFPLGCSTNETSPCEWNLHRGKVSKFLQNLFEWLLVTLLKTLLLAPG